MGAATPTDPAFETLTSLLDRRAATQASDLAYAFLAARGEVEARITFGQLATRSRGLAMAIAAHARPGDRAALVFGPGLDFVVAYFGCLYAGVVPTPLMPPRRLATRDSSEAILRDCRPAVILTTRAVLSGPLSHARARLAEFPAPWIAVDDPIESLASRGLAHAPAREDLALLQYTSGSTSDPKGVMVTHANLLANLDMIRLALGNDRSSTYACWMPLYHDMGLILNVLQALHAGAACLLMAPSHFVQRPLDFLAIIDRHRVVVAGMPNFGYDLCVDRYRADQAGNLDLSSWKVAFNGAEPVNAGTIHRFQRTYARHGFDPNAFYPCYGMAEATLLASGGLRGAGPKLLRPNCAALLNGRAAIASDQADSRTLVGCGKALVGESIAIVDPDTGLPAAVFEVGEIWLQGPNVASGYLGKPVETMETFGAEISVASGKWLRTGDLGFLDDEGELYVAGRLKDVIIIRGTNHYPQDLERTASGAHAELMANAAAAFAIDGDRGTELLVIVQEVQRVHRRDIDIEDVKGCIREAVASEHELSVHSIALIAPGTLPRTSSGKVRRRLTRELWQDGRFDWIDIGSDSGRSPPGE